MRWLLILSIVFSFWTQPAHAEEPSKVRYKLPEVKTDANGQKCLGTEQWKDVIAVASEYKKHFEWRLKIEPVLMEYQAISAAYGLVEDNLQLQIDLLEISNESLKDQLLQSENLKLKIQRGHRIEKGVMWVVILAETVVIGVLGVKSSRVL